MHIRGGLAYPNKIPESIRRSLRGIHASDKI